MSYVYIKSEPTLWTVGFYTPDEKWNAESDWPTSEKAANRTAFLNGGQSKETEKRLKTIENIVASFEKLIADMETMDFSKNARQK